MLVIASIAVTVHVVRSTRPEQQETDIDSARLARRENAWLWLVVVFLVAMLVATIFSIPDGNKSEARVTQHVRVTGLQFAWVMTRTR